MVGSPKAGSVIVSLPPPFPNSTSLAAAIEPQFSIDGAVAYSQSIPLPAADILEDIALPTVERIVERVRRSMDS